MNTAYLQPTDSSLFAINYTKALVITNRKVRRPQYRNVSITTCCNVTVKRIFVVNTQTG